MFRLKRAATYALVSGFALFALTRFVLSRLAPGGWLVVLDVARPVVLAAVLAVTAGLMLGVWLFREGKARSERFADSLLVALVQCLIWSAGGLVTAQAAPAFVVWMSDHFEVASPMEMRSHGKVLPLSEQIQLAVQGVQMRQLIMPEGAQDRQSLLMAELAGQSLAGRLELLGAYRPEQVIAHLRTAPPTDGLRSAAFAAAIASVERCPKGEVGWVPLKSRLGFHTALVSRKDGRICDVLDLDLWDK